MKERLELAQIHAAHAEQHQKACFDEREVLRQEREMLAAEKAAFTASRMQQEQEIAMEHQQQQETGKRLEVMRWELQRIRSEMLDPALQPRNHATAAEDGTHHGPSNGVVGITRPLEKESIEVLIAELAERLREGRVPALAQAYLRKLSEDEQRNSMVAQQSSAEPSLERSPLTSSLPPYFGPVPPTGL